MYCITFLIYYYILFWLYYICLQWFVVVDCDFLHVASGHVVYCTGMFAISCVCDVVSRWFVYWIMMLWEWKFTAKPLGLSNCPKASCSFWLVLWNANKCGLYFIQLSVFNDWSISFPYSLWLNCISVLENKLVFLSLLLFP